jgi:mono/diheme cytochrome c family protein
MLQRLFLAACAAVLAAGVVCAAQTQESKVVIPVTKVPATSGQAMYKDYCAPCHGTDGKGKGPAAKAMKPAPSNLTVLSRKNQGKFPDTHIAAVLRFGVDVPAHGSAVMPVWGPILGKMSQTHPQEQQLRITNLVRYLESIQAK